MCCEDDRHTIRYTSMEKHGHVIAPLMAKGKAVGVFYYYVPCGLRPQPGQRDTFVEIGQQLGLAIENARLYEETRQLSLHDTLTGLGPAPDGTGAGARPAQRAPLRPCIVGGDARCGSLQVLQ
ncbi:MAG: GAF domain-containing protein [Thiohalomonadaceae bacterium]